MRHWLIISTLLVLSLWALNATATTMPTLTDRPDLGPWDADPLFTDKQFVAEARFGDRGGNAEKEFSVGVDTSGTMNTANFNWQNGVWEDFELAYTSGTGLMEFTVGSGTVSWSFDPSLFGGDLLVVRLDERRDPGPTAAYFEFGSWNGDAFSGSPSYTASDGVEHVLVTGIDLAKDFTLTGKVGFSWDDPAGTWRSSPAVQIKGGFGIPPTTSTPPVPEPATVTLLGLGLAGVAVRMRKRR